MHRSKSYAHSFDPKCIIWYMRGGLSTIYVDTGTVRRVSSDFEAPQMCIRASSADNCTKLLGPCQSHKPTHTLTHTRIYYTIKLMCALKSIRADSGRFQPCEFVWSWPKDLELLCWAAPINNYVQLWIMVECLHCAVHCDVRVIAPAMQFVALDIFGGYWLWSWYIGR